MSMTDDQVDALLRALAWEGFGLPHSARSSDYPDDAELRAADDLAHQRNRYLLRRAVAQAHPPRRSRVFELISEMLGDILRGICDGFDLTFGYWPRHNGDYRSKGATR